MAMQLLGILDHSMALYWLVEYAGVKLKVGGVNVSIFGIAESCPSLKRGMINIGSRNHLFMKH